MLIEHYNGKVSVPSQGEHGVLQIPDLLMYYNLGKFPSSTEVRRVFYNLDVSIYAKPELFPSPREVDRFFYSIAKCSKTCRLMSFRPLAR